MAARRARAIRAALVAVVVGALQLGAVAAPSWACACGAIEQLDTASRIDIAGETALVRHDGQSEDILLSFDMSSDSREAALILPLPTKADLALADVNTFDTLRELTKPERRERKRLRGLELPSVLSGGDGAGSGAPPVGSSVHVLEEQELGPFETVQLTSDTADDLRTWLDDNDFRVRDNIVKATQPYLDEGWVLAVVQLKPGTDDPGFEGDLQPIRATFDSDRMVYPMRLQAQAAEDMPLRVYTLTDHRTEVRIGEGSPFETRFAGTLADSQLDDGSTLAELAAGDTSYLTRVDTIIAPEDVTADLTITRSGVDTPHREVYYVGVDYPWVVRLLVPSWGTALAWAVILPLLAAPVVGYLLVRRRRA